MYSLADGSTVYCLQPFKNPPAPGVHTVSEIRDSENPLTKAFYYLYGGPGFADSGLTTGDAFVDYSIAHYVVSYIFDGCQDTGTGNVFNMLDYASLSQVLECYKRLEAMPSVPGEACVLLFDTGYDAQTGEKCQMMGVFAYRQEYGDIELYKSSGNTIMTEDNSCYSLAGAQYGIYPKGSSTPAAVITTDANGYGKAEHIAVGTYDIKEIKTPAGYALDTNAGAVTVNAKGIITYRCQDKPQNNPVTLLIGKTDGETGNNKPPSLRSLKDAEFKIRFYKGYYDTETALTGKNPERTWIMKTDAEGYCRMSEAYKKSGDDFYYNTDGKPTLPLGTVMIQEICAPKGYLINTKVFIRQITAHGSGESVNTYQYPVISEAVQKGIIRVRKQDKETGGGPAGAGTLQGAVYEVFNSLGEKADTMTTDVNGRAQSKKLQLGDYTVKECTPSTGYLKDTQIYTVALKPDQSNQEILYADVLSRETPQKGSINLEKRDKDTGKQEPQGSGTLQGAVYEIVNSSGQVADTITVSAEGQAQSKELPLGTYTIREKKAAPGYNLDLETHTVSLISENRTDRVFYKTVQSEEAIIRGGVMIEKRDLETDKNIAQGSAVLEKAEIQIISKNLKPVLVEGKSYGTGEVITKLCLDKDGRAGTKENYLPYGNYLLKESKAPTGYNNTGIISREFSIRKQGETVKLNTSETSIKNEIIRGDVQLVKFGSDQECEDNDIKKPLKNIRFIFTSRTTGEKYTVITDENGYATTKQLGNPRGGLIYDTYVVTEDSPYEDYAVIKPFEVTISEEQKTLYYIIENDVIEAPVSVVKKDSTTGRVIPVKGTAFQILDEQKNVAKMTVSHYPFLSERDTWETDEAGSFMLPQKLKPGRYYLKELKAPKGYLKGESLEFQVKGNYHWEEPLVVEYEDNPVMGNLVICKTDKVTGDKLAGVVFEIFAGEDILTGDGTVRAVKDELVDTITTDENGRAESKRLFWENTG